MISLKKTYSSIQLKVPLTLLLLAVAFISCQYQNDNSHFEADAILNAGEQHEILRTIIRYAGKLPSRATHDSKFNPEFDEYYVNLAAKHKLDYFYEDESTGVAYFLVSREAPSLHGRRVAIGGKLAYAPNRELGHYEEIFRTWKMAPEELSAKSSLLFREMVKGNSLSVYQPENSGSEEYIEFPNRHVHFDSDAKQWVSTLPLPAEMASQTQYGVN